MEKANKILEEIDSMKRLLWRKGNRPRPKPRRGKGGNKSNRKLDSNGFEKRKRKSR